MLASYYKAIKSISVLSMIIVFLVIILINSFNLNQPIINDIKGILCGIFVGFLFSFLLTINDIRTFILKSVSHFMTDNSYLNRLKKEELIELKDKLTIKMHGVDIVSNKE